MNVSQGERHMGINILLQQKHLYRKGIRLHHNPKLLDFLLALISLTSLHPNLYHLN